MRYIIVIRTDRGAKYVSLSQPGVRRIERSNRIQEAQVYESLASANNVADAVRTASNRVDLLRVDSLINTLKFKQLTEAVQ